jgi:hypothetical protein
VVVCLSCFCLRNNRIAGEEDSAVLGSAQCN